MCEWEGWTKGHLAPHRLASPHLPYYHHRQLPINPNRAGLDFNKDAAKNAAENGGPNAADSAMANTLMLPAFEAQKVTL